MQLRPHSRLCCTTQSAAVPVPAGRLSAFLASLPCSAQATAHSGHQGGIFIFQSVSLSSGRPLPWNRLCQPLPHSLMMCASRCTSRLTAASVLAAAGCPAMHLLRLSACDPRCCRHPDSMLCILWLGSSVGNLQPDEAVQFFKAAQAAAGHKTQVRLCSSGAQPRTSAVSLSAAVHIQPMHASFSCLARVCWEGCL